MLNTNRQPFHDILGVDVRKDFSPRIALLLFWYTQKTYNFILIARHVKLNRKSDTLLIFLDQDLQYYNRLSPGTKFPYQ